jgi:hypothetical protein
MLRATAARRYAVQVSDTTAADGNTNACIPFPFIAKFVTGNLFQYCNFATHF